MLWRNVSDSCVTSCGFWSFFRTHCSTAGFCEWFSILHHSPSVPLFVHLSVSMFRLTSIRPVCVCTFIYLFGFEGCEHICYWFGAVGSDSHWLNRFVDQHFTCHHEELHPLDKCITDLLTLWQGWHLCRFFYLSFPTLCFLFHQFSAIELFYWDWSIDHCSEQPWLDRVVWLRRSLANPVNFLSI